MMLKYILICVAAVVFSFLFAGLLSHVPVKLPRLRVNDRECRYRLYLGCALFITLGASGVFALVGGYTVISVFAIAIAAVGLVAVGACFFKTTDNDGGCKCKDPVGGDCIECTEIKGVDDRSKQNIASNDCGVEECFCQSAIGVERSNGEVVSGCVVKNTATSDCESNFVARVLKNITQKPRIKAIIWCTVFAMCLVFYLMFSVVSDMIATEGDAIGSITEKTVVFSEYRWDGRAAVLEDRDSDDTYLLLGYGLEHELGRDDSFLQGIEEGSSYTVRCIVLERDEWSGIYSILEAACDDGTSYFNEGAVLATREAARKEKLVTLGAVTLICGAASVFYTIFAVREKRKR